MLPAQCTLEGLPGEGRCGASRGLDGNPAPGRPVPCRREEGPREAYSRANRATRALGKGFLPQKWRMVEGKIERETGEEVIS